MHAMKSRTTLSRVEHSTTPFIRIVVLLLAVSCVVSGCGLLRNPENERERNATRLLDTDQTKPTRWYCYGQSEEVWECRKARDLTLVKTIQPEPRNPETPMATAPEPNPWPVASDPLPASIEDNPLLSAPADFFTVQLIALDNEADIIAYANTNGIESPLYARIQSGDDVLYVLLLDIYPDQASATAAMNEWMRTRALRIDPWIRRLGPLQQAIQLARATQ